VSRWEIYHVMGCISKLRKKSIELIPISFSFYANRLIVYLTSIVALANLRASFVLG
jgi:hypothetical protein